MKLPPTRLLLIAEWTTLLVSSCILAKLSGLFYLDARDRELFFSIMVASWACIFVTIFIIQPMRREFSLPAAVLFSTVSILVAALYMMTPRVQ
jgi:hypothetical protein